MGDLAEELDVSVASATGIVDRMEQRGLVERRHGPDDRRVVMVDLTATGGRHVSATCGEHRDAGPPHRGLTTPSAPGLAASGCGRCAPRATAADLPTTTGHGQVGSDGRRTDDLAPPPTSAPTGARSRRPGRCSCVQAIANLYLPSLNADIINNGVAKGDTDYILRTGGFMLVVTLRARRLPRSSRVYFGARPRWASGATSAAAIFQQVETFSQVEMNHFGTAVAHHPQHERRPAGPDGRLHGPDVMILAPIMGVGGVIMALRQDVPLSGLLLVILPLMAVVHRARHVAGRSRSSARCRSSSTGSTRSCARRWPASASSAPSSGREHEERASTRPTATCSTTALRVNRLFAADDPDDDG